jgi:ABC-2 type transport system permease protein
VNWQHFRAFLWLRWRLRVNQFKRGGVANAIILGILAVATVIAAISLFVIFFLVGLFISSWETALVVLFVWDGLVLAMLFFWAVGLLAELQRSEVLSLDKFLHLPVSLWGAFLLNYLSSLFSLNLVIFLPGMVGFSLGLVGARGSMMLLTLPLLAAFVLMVTALTYQFQGWLAALMVNKRRRRTIIVVMTIVFVLLCQLPNMLNVFRSKNVPFFDKHGELKKDLAEARTKNRDSRSREEVTQEQFEQKEKQLRREYDDQVRELNQQTWEAAKQLGWLVNLVLPPGWLPLGAMMAVQGNPFPALLGTVGLTLIGTLSLWRAYRTTVRLYTGQYTGGKGLKPLPATGDSPPLEPPKKSGVRFAERRIPWVSEQASAIALACFRSLTRAPEAKMMFLTPVILTVIFGSTFLSNPFNPPPALRPLMVFGGMATALLGTVQLVGNQFGFDRSGFRVFVLCAARRSDILLGKNLAFAPLAFGLAIAMAALVQAFYPLRLDHCLAAFPQMISMYLTLCLMGNLLSILAPMPIAAGSFKPSNPKLVPILLQLVFFFLLPTALLPMLLPLGIELLLHYLAGIEGIPVCLLLTVIECVGVVLLYRLVLGWEGLLLQSREQKILEIVTSKSE